MDSITTEIYDEILDSFDNENINNIVKLFKDYCLEPYSELIDSPRITDNDNIVLNTYLEYVLYYNLTNIIDLFIDDMNLVIDDDVLASALILENTDTYNYLCNLGYTPEEQTLKIAVQMRYSEIVDSILENDSNLIYNIEEDDIEYLLKIDIDEETVETVRVLCSYHIDNMILQNFFSELKERNLNNSNSDDDNNDDNSYMILELINILENYK